MNTIMHESLKITPLFRRLKEGEIVLETDQYYDDHKRAWVAPQGSVGGPAPNPSYTAHRQFRRPVDFFDPAALGYRLRTQDNMGTAHPIFVVEQKVRVYGFDPDYVDAGDEHIVWIECDDFSEVRDHEERQELEDEFQSTGRQREGYSRTVWQEHWEWVQPFFTREAAELYLAQNAHNLKSPRIYCHSGYRNREWQQVMAMLIQLSQAQGVFAVPEEGEQVTP